MHSDELSMWTSNRLLQKPGYDLKMAFFMYDLHSLTVAKPSGLAFCTLTSPLVVALGSLSLSAVNRHASHPSCKGIAYPSDYSLIIGKKRRCDSSTSTMYPTTHH